jgi:hypothetical protein
MASVTLPRRAHYLHSIRKHRNSQPYNTDDEETSSINDDNYHNLSKIKKVTKTLSCDQPEVQSSSITTSNNRLRDLCSRWKRRFSLTKENHIRNEDINGSVVSERRMNRLGSDKSFSSTVDESSNQFEWPDFEKVYESIPSCLINALPGLDDFSTEENDDNLLNIVNFQTDSTDQYSIEQMNLFIKCKRGKFFRRNAICQKLDKNQHNGQLDLFIQQLMIEKLMRTWT